MPTPHSRDNIKSMFENWDSMIVTFIRDDWDTAIRVSVIEIPGRRPARQAHGKGRSPLRW